MDGSPPIDFFGPGSPYLAHPLLTEERTAQELDEIEALVGPANGRDVLDVGCGFGRHSVEAARRGATVTAFDPSETMIDAALARAADAGVTIDAHVGSGPAIVNHGAATADIALCLFTTLGQRDPFTAPSDDQDRDLLQAIFQSLRPGAALVLELPDRARHVTALVEHEQLGPTTALRSFDATTSTVRERFDTADGTSFHLAYRVYARDDLRQLLQDSGFVVEAMLDRPLVSPPPTLMTIVARRPTS